MTWNNCPIQVTDEEFDPERHILPVVRGTAIRAGEYVGLVITEMPAPMTAHCLANFNELWALTHVGIALEDGVSGSPIKVQCSRNKPQYWAYKHKVAAKYLEPV